jgi:hypothetical protein
LNALGVASDLNSRSHHAIDDLNQAIAAVYEESRLLGIRANTDGIASDSGEIAAAANDLAQHRTLCGGPGRDCRDA